MGRSRLYGLVIVACLTGWGWLGYYALSANAHETTEPDVCLIKVQQVFLAHHVELPDLCWLA